jgi:hypothetical protein
MTRAAKESFVWYIFGVGEHLVKVSILIFFVFKSVLEEGAVSVNVHEGVFVV